LKTQINLPVPLLFAFLVLMQGCGEKQPDFRPISGGFGVATKWVGVDSGPGAALFYKGNQSKPALIWPFLTDDLFFTNDMVFFIGDVPDDQGRLGSGFYFAAQAPGPAMDISEDILKLWAESNHLDFAGVRGRYVPLEEDAVGNGIRVHFLGDEKLPATYVIGWEQVSNIIQDVKRTGKQHVIDNPVLKLHIVYLKKDYGSTNDTK
jgi:hypothetical protein